MDFLKTSFIFKEILELESLTWLLTDLTQVLPWRKRRVVGSSAHGRGPGWPVAQPAPAGVAVPFLSGSRGSVHSVLGAPCSILTGSLSLLPLVIGWQRAPSLLCLQGISWARVSDETERAVTCYFSGTFWVVMSGYWTEDTASTFLR